MIALDFPFAEDGVWLVECHKNDGMLPLIFLLLLVLDGQMTVIRSIQISWKNSLLEACPLTEATWTGVCTQERIVGLGPETKLSRSTATAWCW
jgi:hypothetical protein